MMFGHHPQKIHDVAAHKSKIASIAGDVDVRKGINQPIENLCGPALKSGLPGAMATLPVHHIRLLAIHQGEHVSQELRWILQVGIDYGHPVSASSIKTCCDGKLMAVVA